MGEVLHLIDLNSFLQIWVYSGFLYLFVLVRKEKKKTISEIIHDNGQKKKKPFIHKGLLDQHIVRPPEWSISAQRCSDLLYLQETL